MVRHRFVKGADRPESGAIEFPRFQFNTALVGKIINDDAGEIRISGARADAGELGKYNSDGSA